jgi:hypothetical protein
MASDLPLLAAVLVIVLIAGMVKGITGFGFVLVAAPLMTIFIDPKMVVPAIIIQTLPTSVPILLHAYHHLRIRRMWLMALAGMAGVPVGTLVLLVLDASLLRLLIGTVVTMVAVVMMLGFRKPLQHELMASVPVGFVGGMLCASTGMSGPPVIFFYTNQRLNTREFRANIVAYFVMLDIVTLSSFIIAGLLPGETVSFSVQLLPVSLVGVIGGIVVNRWVQERLFRRIALVLILLAGIMSAATGISGL